MDSIFKFEQKEKSKRTKYSIFSMLFTIMLFAFVLFGAQMAKAVTVEVIDSNHKGNNAGGSYAAKNPSTGTSDDFRYFVQGTGKELTDVVALKITDMPTNFDRIAFAEANYNMSAVEDKRNYDSYYYENDKWNHDKSTSKNVDACVQTGAVNCGNASTAGSTLMAANTGDYIALFYMNGDTLYYVYTIRNAGYGLKSIHLYFYDAESQLSQNSPHTTIAVVVSKPINEFNDSGFTWVDGTATCGTHNSNTGVAVTLTNNICFSYTNGSTTNEDKDLFVTIPKEVAYLHTASEVSDATNASVSDVTGQSIYAINTFQNSGSSKFVKYYYYQFVLTPYTDSISVSVSDMEQMNEDYYYYLLLKIDASGDYRFYIKDYFGNYFDHTANTDADVEINDVSQRNILADYTNADLLTILDARLITVDGSTDFGGNTVALQFIDQNGTSTDGTPYKVMFIKMQKDGTVIDVEIFTRIKIKYGVYYCKGETNSATCGNVEDIRKQAAKKEEINHTNTGYWQSASNALSSNSIDGVSRVTFSAGDYQPSKSFINSDYHASEFYNRLEIDVTKNGRYRIYVEDVYGNSTNDNSGSYKNPYVDVTVIDSTTPTVDGSNKDNLESFAYVNGGGEKNPSVDLISNGDNTTIWYTNKGDKYFDYQDAITLAGISAKDSTTLAAYYTEYASGAYSDPAKSLLSDRYTSGTTVAYGGSVDLHYYILDKGIESFTGGLIRPNESYDITVKANGDREFKIGATTYTIAYGVDDVPDSVTPGSITVTNRMFTIGTTSYMIVGDKRVATYSTSAAFNEVPVAGTSYSLAGTASQAMEEYLITKTKGDVNATAYPFVTALDNPLNAVSYANTYIGFVEIDFLNVDGESICSIGEDVDANNICFLKINKQIDTVEDFKMTIRVYDYVGHVSTAKTVTVTIKDTTAPGYLPEFVAQGDSSKWTNVFAGSSCMLEIGNKIQSKSTLINCYKLGQSVNGESSGTYNYKDNDTTYNDPGTYPDDEQWYGKGSFTKYFNSIKLEIETDTANSFTEVTDSSNIVLNKARQHKLRITIYDNWDPKNSLEIIVEYYVNPRILLIEPIANSKVYGEADPTFQYCVYINKSIDTFSMSDDFFDLSFINTHFKIAYCTNPANFDSTKVHTGITAGNVGVVGNVLLNGNEFSGALSRVESAWYNTNVGVVTSGDIDDEAVAGYTKLSGVQNNYVGYYNIVLGNLGIANGSGSPSCASYGCEKDYVIKMKPHVLVKTGTGSNDGSDGNAIIGVTSLGATQTQNKDADKNDSPYTESTIQFTIKQNVLTVTANGGSKTFGEQDSNSHNWNTGTTVVQSTVVSGYLGGYTVVGYQNNSTNYYYDATSNNIIEGILRRQIGEQVGKYSICNIKTATPSSTITGCASDASYAPEDDSYSTTAGETYMFAAYGNYGLGGTDSAAPAALKVRTNAEIYTDAGQGGKKLNTGNRNYVIAYAVGTYIIEANEMVVQPGINQGKEYSENEYLDPVWQIVVYGETINNNTGSWVSNILVATNAASEFSGYTESINATMPTYTTPTIANYRNNSDAYSDDTEVYYSRRKTSPDVEYIYRVNVPLTKDGSNYTNVYEKSNDYYYRVSSTTTSGKYVYAYGGYHAITTATADYVTIDVKGHLVNETYTLFLGTSGTAGSAKITRASGKAVGWYTFNAINNETATFKVATNSNNHCTIATNSITVDGTDACKNYNLTFDTSAPDSHLKSDGSAATVVGTVSKIITTNGTSETYKPDGINACTDGDIYTKACESDTSKNTQVLFEIFKREIVIKFDIVDMFNYGFRYDYFDGGATTINGGTYNNKNGVFKVKDSSSEGYLFKCFSEHHIEVNCTSNPDYGITAGDTWTSIGLEFFMHHLISSSSSAYYDSGSDSAIPAGTYYVYANIKEAVKANYKFTYLGGTLTIEPKAGTIQLTSYTKEYKTDKYYSYGLGTDYSTYTEYATKCMVDTDYQTSGNNNLISSASCLNLNNAVGNSYGFQVEELDSMDTIANNFVGRPSRVAGENVGIYKISPNTIASKVYNLIATEADTNECATQPDTYLPTSGTTLSTNCAMVKDSERVNYNITYSKTNNEGAYLFITPATITITVYEDQTKMYGCAYSDYNTAGTTYTIDGGYTNCDASSTASDIAYKYHVAGDKDKGAEYDVEKNVFPTNSALEGSLYRVDYSSSAIDYSDFLAKTTGGIYQGQSVGDYIITLGDLNAKVPDGAQSKCDAFNNPSVTGTITCRNYNLNYYGNSASKDNSASDDSNDQHKYTGTITVNVADLQTYDLNYVTTSATQYVDVNGKKVNIADQASSKVKYYISIDDYNTLASAGISTYYYSEVVYYDYTGAFIHILDGEVLLADGTTDNVSGYVDISSLKVVDDYIKINNKDVALSSLSRFSSAAGRYDSGPGGYAEVNGVYTKLDYLDKYSLVDGKYVLDNANGTYILAYGNTTDSGLDKYNLNVADTYVANADGTGAYVFVNGSYVLKSSIAPAGTTSITVNSAMKNGGLVNGTANNDANGVATDVKFTITYRDVHVHTEYNVKYVGNNDVDEVITCEQIKSAYGLTDFTDRSYCSSASSITLGKARYYAIDNSLAKYPWTEWMDKNQGKNDVVDKDYYNDAQFDVINGALERASGEIVGKYTYDFKNIKVNGDLSGSNYRINIETITDWDNTYLDNGGSNKLSSQTRYSDANCTITDNLNGYYIKVGGTTCTSISMVNKYRSNGTKIDFWYLGFYIQDGSDGRTGELAKWWNNAAIFANSYAKFIQGQKNDGSALSSTDGYLGIYDPDLSEQREVYFEIMRRTIYLYTVDSTKIYGTPDRYGDFQVAICATDNGYTVDGTGVKCNDPGTVSTTHGLSPEHKGYFYNGAYMKQGNIKGGDGYIFVGTANNSMEIYFKRNVGEDVGVYTITACATQYGISDCTDPSQEESPNAQRQHIGDDYIIIEIPGTLTIETREITIVPDADQGFMYGNYPHNGQIPAITYKEYHGYQNDANQGVQGMVNSGNSVDASATASCFINVSGDSVVCINDNQNNVITPSAYEILGDYATDVKTTYSGDTWKAKYVINKNDVYKDSYSDPDNVGSRSESDTRHALNRICGSNTDLRYSRDVCNYVIVEGELTDDSKWDSKTREEYVRIVKSKVYNDNTGSSLYTVSEGQTYDPTGKYLEVNGVYHQITSSNRYAYSYVSNADGAYINISGSYYKIIGANRYSDGSCSTRVNDGGYFKHGGSACTQITASNRYNLSKNLTANSSGDFIKITVTNHNYIISNKFKSGVVYEVTPATLTVTPLENQFKIYGEADPEIKFNVLTTYTVSSDQRINVIDLNYYNILNQNGSEYSYSPDASGFINVGTGQTVILNGYAYAENMTDSELNYGKNYTAIKHTEALKGVKQSTTGATHFDVHSAYKSTIYDNPASATESRILIGNFYVEGHNQEVGVRNISNGFIVGVNALATSYAADAYRNYVLPNGNVNASGVTFTIIPRPAYVKIDDITKTYGQATDKESCDSGVTCSAIDGILQSYAEGYMKYNYHVVTSGMAITLPTTQLGGVAVYSNSAINLPDDVTTSTARSGYTDLTTITSGKYYTADKAAEEKNVDLQIIVQRGNYNTSRSTATCYVQGEVPASGTGKGCEDVGVYYMRFAGNNSTTLGEAPTTVSTYYHNDYWGYNTNYYVIIENTQDVSSDTALVATTAADAGGNTPLVKDTQKKGATLTINKKKIIMVVETFETDRSSYEYSFVEGGTGVTFNTNFFEGTLGQTFSIEENMDVPALPTESNGEYEKFPYNYVTWKEHPAQVRTKDTIHGDLGYYPIPVELPGSGDTVASKYGEVQAKGDCSGNVIVSGETGLNCSTNALIYHNPDGDDKNSYNNNANSGPNVFDTSRSGYYPITRDRNRMYIRYDNGTTMNSITATNRGDYEANNYITIFVNGILAVDDDETAPVIYAGSEYYAIEANNGVLTGINSKTEDNTYAFLNSIKANHCNAVTGKENGEGKVVDYETCKGEYFTTAIKVDSNTFMLNNYKYTISGNTISSNRSGFSSVSINESTGEFTIDSKTYKLIKSGGTPVLITRPEASPQIQQDKVAEILQWFNIRSHDPSVIRNGEGVQKRYDARYYIAIDENFNQRVTGDYTVFIYALDNAGNISRATTVTLRVKDVTDPITGYLNLYEGNISCDFATKDCVTDKNAWTGTAHVNWSNNFDGIWMSIVGGQDNTINYLNIDGRKQFTLTGDVSSPATITVGVSGTHLLYGTMVNLDNMTQYYKEGDNYFVREPRGTYGASVEFFVRYKGQYKKITELTRYSLSGSTYTKVAGNTTSNVYILDGSFVELPEYRYNITDGGVITQTSSGKFIKLDQWDHYFSRDNGATWFKYDREDVNGYLALESDGQRLILIKAADMGINYTTATSTNTMTGTANEYFSATYSQNDTTYEEGNANYKNGIKWNTSGKSPVEATEAFTEYSVYSANRNVAPWVNTAEDGYYRDRKYAYLDTQRPQLTLDNNGLWVYEYGCTDCDNGYNEEYGYTSDSYLLPLSIFKRYSDAAATTVSDSGNYIRVPSKVYTAANDIEKDTIEIMSLTDRLYASSGTEQASCSGKWVNGTCYTKSSSGTHVYVGKIVTDTNAPSIDSAFTTIINGDATNRGTTVNVYVNNGTATTEEKTNIALKSTNATEQTETSTIYNVSGVSGDNLMTGTQNTDKQFEELNHAHKKIVIYLTVAEPYTRTSPSLSGGIFGSQNNTATTYYKFEMVCVDGSPNTCTISATASTSDNKVATGTTYAVTVETSGETDELKKAIYTIIASSLDGKSYSGKDLTYSVNYTTTDMAGNVSETKVRGIIFSNFLEAVGTKVVDANGNSTVFYGAAAVNVAQNGSVVAALGNFTVTTSKSGSNPLLDRYLVQSVYYNDKLISSDQKYDPSTLENLDTSTPGVYKIVYSTRRLHNGELVVGTPFELTINVKPNVAAATVTKADYKQIIITTLIASSIVAVCVYIYLSSKKRKFN